MIKGQAAMMPGRSENFAPPVAIVPRYVPLRTRNALDCPYTALLQNTGENTV